ncbi:hypothetical protein E1301_Tti007057 [Triplophysa tibetana]|uniref:Uncharacterized protein n=1 Tax=Triplophysa tibetana TaxID=1572043 RepID=A0A5A9PP01_9TELE|nr:hypothetical protein E1301_Tti007057 [Triplophysa tibetana]
MSRSSIESQSRGGSVLDVRMASSNTSSEGGSPPHPNRIRQGFLQEWKMDKINDVSRTARGQGKQMG